MIGSEAVVRVFKPEDWDAVWAILEPVFRSGETYAVDPDISEGNARSMWTSAPREVFVATDDEERIVGTYYLKPNQDGPGAHVCNCGYVVAEAARGHGVAAAMCRHSQEVAMRRGFRAMQFNFVAATNAGAVRLWTKLGFDVVGTLPLAFRHPREGFVDAYVMYKQLSEQ